MSRVDKLFKNSDSKVTVDEGIASLIDNETKFTEQYDKVIKAAEVCAHNGSYKVFEEATAEMSAMIQQYRITLNQLRVQFVPRVK